MVLLWWHYANTQVTHKELFMWKGRVVSVPVEEVRCSKNTLISIDDVKIYTMDVNK